nr:MAG TPA: hypothetical protein [Caudoviricetes sp.]
MFPCLLCLFSFITGLIHKVSIPFFLNNSVCFIGVYIKVLFLVKILA